MKERRETTMTEFMSDFLRTTAFPASKVEKWAKEHAEDNTDLMIFTADHNHYISPESIRGYFAGLAEDIQPTPEPVKKKKA